MKTRISLVSTGSLCALIAMASIAEASDKKIYPATSCRPDAESEGTVYYSTSGAVYNVSTTETLTLVCPVVRDNTADAWVAISVVARNPGDAGVIWCTAESRYSSSTLYKKDDRYLGEGGTSWITVPFEAKPAPASGFYQIICRLPRHSKQYAPGIASYSVTEP
jgi:hypothetical protein